jgi:hypothetical protein
MSPSRIRELLSQTPFTPFTVVTGDGSSVDLLSPEFAFLLPGGRSLLVSVPLKSKPKEEEDIKTHYVDVFLITKVEQPRRRRTKR